MGRLPRFDAPFESHHVMCRALARRTMFETGQDLRYFASLLAQEVRRGLIEIDAEVGLSTHFHMLVVSRLGRLSEAMRNILNAYVRKFNRGRRRDGPLMRGRFESRPIDSIAYRMTLVRYIDFNPVQARLAEEPWQYPYGSARYHIAERGPRWIRRQWIDDVLRTSPQRDEDRAKTYCAIFGNPLTAEQCELVEQRLRHPRSFADPTDDLLVLGAPAVLRWMQRKARLADGTLCGHPVCTPGSLEAAVLEELARRGRWSLKHGHVQQDVWNALRTGLLRSLSAATREEVARRLQISPASVSRAEQRHLQWLASEPEYAAIVSELGARAIASCFGSRDQIEMLRQSLPGRTVPGTFSPGSFDPGENVPGTVRPGLPESVSAEGERGDGGEVAAGAEVEDAFGDGG